MTTEEQTEKLLEAARAVCINYNYTFEDLEFEPFLEELKLIVKEIDNAL